MDRRKRYTKKQSISRPLKQKSVYDNVHLVKRYGSAVNGIPNTGTVIEYINNPAEDQSYRLFFRLSAVTAYEDFTKLYDQYKIRAVKVSLIPIMNITTADKSGYASLVYTTYDFNGETTVPTRDQIREYQYCKWSPYGNIHERYFFPRTIETSWGTSFGTKVGPQNWMATASPDAPYFGLIVNVANVPSVPTNQSIYKVEVKYYISFRNTK